MQNIITNNFRYRSVDEMSRVISLFRYLFYVFFLYQIQCKTCTFSVKIEQKLHNVGFHRNLSYNIEFTIEEKDEKLYEDCVIGLEQTLPAGVYASQDEIKDHKCINLIHTSFLSPVNIEQPAKDANPIIVHLYSKMQNSISNINIPVHARYHHASRGGGTVRNIIISPKLYLSCPNKRLNVCDFAVSSLNNFCKEGVPTEYCPWKEIPVTMLTDTIFWDVPIGNTDHYYVVAWGTTIVVIVGSLYLLKTIHEYKTDERIKKKLK